MSIQTEHPAPELQLHLKCFVLTCKIFQPLRMSRQHSGPARHSQDSYSSVWPSYKTVLLSEHRGEMVSATSVRGGSVHKQGGIFKNHIKITTLSQLHFNLIQSSDLLDVFSYNGIRSSLLKHFFP